jgi:flagellar hook-length control protein FliK
VSAEAPKGGATETDSAFGQRLAGVVAKAAELAEELRSRVTARPATRQATIALNPPELGKVQIQVHLDASDRMHATLAAASAKAAELLAHHVDQLRSALAQAGIRFDQFTQTGSQPQTDAHGSGTGANSRGEESRGVSSGEDDGRAAPDPAEEQSGALRRSWILFGRPRRLDVVV